MMTRRAEGECGLEFVSYKAFVSVKEAHARIKLCIIKPTIEKPNAV